MFTDPFEGEIDKSLKMENEIVNEAANSDKMEHPIFRSIILFVNVFLHFKMGCFIFPGLAIPCKFHLSANFQDFLIVPFEGIRDHPNAASMSVCAAYVVGAWIGSRNCVGAA